MNTQYIYLLQEREFIKTKESIYKIGKTKQENDKRFRQYPKDSILLLQIICNDCNQYESDLISLFKLKYIHRKDIGNEYFEGNYKEMICDIYNITYKEETKVNNIILIEEKEDEQLKKLIWNDNLDKLKKYIDDNINKPNQINIHSHELYDWFITQFENYNKCKLNKIEDDNIMRNKIMYDKFTDFIENYKRYLGLDKNYKYNITLYIEEQNIDVKDVINNCRYVKNRKRCNNLLICDNDLLCKIHSKRYDNYVKKNQVNQYCENIDSCYYSYDLYKVVIESVIKLLDINLSNIKIIKLYLYIPQVEIIYMDNNEECKNIDLILYKSFLDNFNDITYNFEF
jgi:hypothetical protein